jgi:hypothetical protein
MASMQRCSWIENLKLFKQQMDAKVTQGRKVSTLPIESLGQLIRVKLAFCQPFCLCSRERKCNSVQASGWNSSPQARLLGTGTPLHYLPSVWPTPEFPHLHSGPTPEDLMGD